MRLDEKREWGRFKMWQNHTDTIRPSVCEHSLHVTCKLRYASIRLCCLSEAHSISPSTDRNHDLGTRELSADGGDRGLGLKIGGCVGGGKGEDDMVDTLSICRALWAGGMPSERFVSVLEQRLAGKEHSLIGIHKETGMCRSCKQRRKERQ
jgi:hypothetical protein